MREVAFLERYNLVLFIIILFDQWYKEDQTQVLPTYWVFSYIYNYYYIMLRMHKKTRKIQFDHKTDKAENNQRIKRNEEKVCVCLDVGGCLVSICTFKPNYLDLFMNKKTEYKIKQLSA